MLDLDRGKLAEICRRFGVRRLELFGSALGDRFDAARSDVDFFVDFGDEPLEGSFRRYMGLKFALEDWLGRAVDLVELAAVTNRFFLQATADRKEVYAA